MNIAIVGGGTGGTNIIKSLVNVEDVKIVVVIDKNLDAPGILLAKKLGLSFSQSIDAIAGKDADIIIEVTGSSKVAEILNEKYGKTHKIIDSQGALLIMTLVKRNIATLEKLSNQIQVINNTSEVVQSQLGEISNSIENIHDVTDKLSDFTRVSGEYIEESDKITQYVNKIAQQTKILGINAAIEAARAGENGRAFSVVAEEVQDLAGNSQNYAKEVNNILSKLSGEIKKVNIEAERLKKLSQVQIEASGRANTAVDELMKQTK